MDAKVNKERKWKTETNDEDETIMAENDELYEPGDEIENIRKYTPDDVIMHENNDLYATGKTAGGDIMNEDSIDDDVVMEENDDIYEGPDDQDDTPVTKLDRRYESLKMNGHDENKVERLDLKNKGIDNDDNDSVSVYENNELYLSSVDLAEDGDNEITNDKEEEDKKMKNRVILPKTMANEPGFRQSFV